MTQTLYATLLTDGFLFGEGPRWHESRLWFTDGPAGAVKTVDRTGKIEIAVESAHASGLGWLPDGTLVISALQEARLDYCDANGALVTQDLSDHGWSTNDMVVSPDGKIYVDVYRLNEEGISGEVALVTLDREVRVVTSGLTLPNGLAITADGSTLIASDTLADRLVAFTIEPDGSLTDQRVFAELDAGQHPDGLCLDAEGAAWVGCYDSEVFLRVLEGGEITHRIETGGGWAVAPALGGTDRCTLYLIINTTTHEGVVTGESTGRIEKVRVDVPGAGWP